MAEVIEEAIVNPYIGKEPEVLADELYTINQQLKGMNAEVKGVEDTRTLIQDALLDYKTAHPTCRKVGTDTCTVTFNEETVYNVTDWDALSQFICENQMLSLLYRRVNNAAVKELLAQGTELACISPFTQRKLGVTKA